MALTRPQLDDMLRHGCQCSNCVNKNKPLKELFLKANCHPSAGVTVHYTEAGILVIECRKCKKLVAEVFVANFN